MGMKHRIGHALVMVMSDCRSRSRCSPPACRLGVYPAVPHGFRSRLLVWASTPPWHWSCKPPAGAIEWRSPPPTRPA